MSSTISKKYLDEAFAQIVAAAVAGERCPGNGQEGRDGLRVGATTALARAGRVRFEVYAHNWRVAEILDGEHRGKRTAACPVPHARPYLTVGKETRRRMSDGRMLPVAASPRIAPPTRYQETEHRELSAPRTLTREELER